MSLLCLALRPLLARFAVDGPAFTSIFQGATRWQTYVALAVSGNLFGDLGLALASVAMVAIIPLVNVFSVSVLAHYASPEKQSAGAIVMTVVSNPLIWACVIGLALNVTHMPLPKTLARGRRRARPLLARHRPAGDRRRPASRRHVPPEPCRRRRRVPQAGADAGASRSRWRCGSALPVPASRSSPPARRCPPRPAPMCWRGRWAAMRRCWRRSSRCRPSWRRSRCRS